LRHAFVTDTGMRFYDAELPRARAHTFTERNERAAGFAAAWEYLVDTIKRIPADSRLPELAQALAVLQSADQNALRK
jgi:hypothetical protein